MDDDLMSLRGGPSSNEPAPSMDDNPLGLGLDDFAPAPIAADAPLSEPVPISTPAPVSPAKSKPAPKAKAKAKPKARRAASSSGGFMGMTPQQGMLLSIFLFLDVSVLGCLILIALGVKFPGT